MSLRELEPDILLSAYASAIFPMADEDGEIFWLSPDPRAVLPLEKFHVPRTLRVRGPHRRDVDFTGNRGGLYPAARAGIRPQRRDAA